MKAIISKVSLDEIQALGAQYLQENNFQIRYHACHERNWTDSYLIQVDGKKIGYGSVKGKEELKDRDAIFEFYLIPHYRYKASQIFEKLLKKTAVPFLECQTNDLLTSAMVYEFGENIYSDVVLFEAHSITSIKKAETIFRKYRDGDDVFGKSREDIGDYVLEKEKEIIATGGFLLHYNYPFADLYMEVKKECQKQGYGSFFIQELIRECYSAGRVPAARCNISNRASKATLLRGGMRVCGYMLKANIRTYTPSVMD